MCAFVSIRCVLFFVAVWLQCVCFPQGKGAGGCARQGCRSATKPTQHSPGGAVEASKGCIWQLDNLGHEWPARHVGRAAMDVLALAAQSQRDLHSLLQELKSLLVSTGEIFGLCSSNQAKG